MIEKECIIIGGGPAGSTCALKLKQAGLDTIIIDKEKFPRPKLCAGWITPKVLRNLEINPESYPYGLLTFNQLYFHLHGVKIPIKTKQYSIRRTEFDTWLLKRSGVSVDHHRVQNIRKENGTYIIDDIYRCKYLIGAGGTNCPVYHTFFREASSRVPEQQIICMETEFPYDVQNTNCYLWFFDRGLRGYSWYVPKAGGYVNIGTGGKFHDIQGPGKALKTHWEHFIDTLDRLSLVNGKTFHPRGYNYYPRQKIQKVQLDNAFIIGDAAGLATSDMGEGIGPAVESGILAAQAIIQGSEYSLKSVTRSSLFNILFKS